MKKDLHPDNYRQVVVQDTSNDTTFLTRSTAKTEETIKWDDGKNYPLLKVHISSTSHPFYTGQEKLVDIEGRVDKFKARREAAVKRREELVKKAQKQMANSNRKEANTRKVGEKARTQPLNRKPQQPRSEKPAEKPLAEQPMPARTKSEAKTEA
jgi:large subunit ribosomal protein L31